MVYLPCWDSQKAEEKVVDGGRRAGGGVGSLSSARDPLMAVVLLSSIEEARVGGGHWMIHRR